MSRIDINIHYSSFENLFTKEKSHFWCILSSWSLNFINNCNLLATSACLMLSGSNTYIKLKPAIYPTPTSPTYIYLITKSLYLINNLLVLFRKASLSLSNLLIPSSHLETFGLVFVPNKFTFSRIIMYMCQTGSVHVSCVLIAGRQAGPAATEWVEDIRHQTKPPQPSTTQIDIFSMNMHYCCSTSPKLTRIISTH